ncbi:hypothetical protein Mal4_49370 [Maioricimonas rarisocia]|uniref:DUF11 domain-containing protein n=1 Tax=Maioricimonas rarisocia TaxID=2528026 RepID=A0A517ZDP7_9PLAN|nr:DUF11 domain-containing protein [Maioricimonas rarisocia]QDU40579.1 hypothetical protein Mal4_49370 [Maioricimonas rarisocia]
MAAPGHLLRPRHLIPVVFAIWYQFLRFLLRVRWWGRDAIAWCRLALPRARAFAAATAVVAASRMREAGLRVWEFVQRPVRVAPTWTLGAIAGTLGVMLTVLLFLFPGEQPAVARTPAAAEQEEQPEPAPEEPEPQPEPEPAPQPKVVESSRPMPVFEPEPEPAEEFVPRPVPTPPSMPRIEVDWLHTQMPPGWDPTELKTVVSVPVRPEPYQRTDPFAVEDLWTTRTIRAEDEAADEDDFVSYFEQLGVPKVEAMGPPFLSASETVPEFDRPLPAFLSGLNVVKQLPPETPDGEPLRYTVVVRNVGEHVIENLVIREEVPDPQAVSTVSPPAAVDEDGFLQWDLGTLAPEEVRELSVVMTAKFDETVETRSFVAATSRVAAVTQVQPPPEPEPAPEQPLEPEPEPVVEPEPEPEPTPHPLPEPVEDPEPALPFPRERIERPMPRPFVPPASSIPARPPVPVTPPVEEEPEPEPIVEPQPEPIVEPEPEPVPEPRPARKPLLTLKGRMTTSPIVAGGPVAALYEVTNHGNAVATDVVITVNLPAELKHEHGRVVEHRIARLAPGETRRARLETIAVSSGRIRLEANVNSAETAAVPNAMRVQIEPEGKRTEWKPVPRTSSAGTNPAGYVPVPCFDAAIF